MPLRLLSPSAARRVAISASQLAQRRVLLENEADAIPSTSAVAPARQVARTVRRMGVLQIDSVNVFARAHYMPLYSRLGVYSQADLDALSATGAPRVFEYWGHEATYLPIETWPLWHWRKDNYRTREGRGHAWAHENAAFVDWLREYVAENGPVSARNIDHERNQRTGSWWGWSDVKRGLEWLFLIGDLTAADRNRFERVYATPEQVIPARIRALDPLTPADSRRALVATAAANLGVFTAADAADYFRMTKPEALTALAELEADGVIEPVRVDGWRDNAWMHARQPVPRRVDAHALLSPFDPLIWFRPRAERLFDFHYRIEIYTPEAQRVYGYYTLPYLLGDQIVARVDLKADRVSGVLQVKAAWAEAGAPAHTAVELAASLWEAAAWQGLHTVLVHEKGNLATELTIAVSAARH